MRIRRGLSSRHLPCGCVAGVYETYDDKIVMIVDAPGAACANPAHAKGNVIPLTVPSNRPSAAQDNSHS